jgi:hypothetical protein
MRGRRVHHWSMSLSVGGRARRVVPQMSHFRPLPRASTAPATSTRVDGQRATRHCVGGGAMDPVATRVRATIVSQSFPNTGRRVPVRR